MKYNQNCFWDLWQLFCAYESIYASTVVCRLLLAFFGHIVSFWLGGNFVIMSVCIQRALYTEWINSEPVQRSLKFPQQRITGTLRRETNQHLLCKLHFVRPVSDTKRLFCIWTGIVRKNRNSETHLIYMGTDRKMCILRVNCDK